MSDRLWAPLRAMPIAPARVPDAAPGALPVETERAVVALSLALPLVAAVLGASGHLGAFPSVLLGGALACGLSAAIGRAARSALPLARIAAVAYALAAALGAVVIADNQRNFGVPFTSGFDDSFYWFNSQSIAEGGALGAEHATLFEYVAAAYYTALATLGPVAPADLLPLNWALSAVTLTSVFAAAESLTGRAPPLGLALLGTYGNAQFCLCVPHLYRDMLVTAGFAFAVLFALKGRPALALLGAAVTLGTRTAHGFLALFAVASLFAARSAAFKRHPRAITACLAVLVTAGALLVSRGSAAMLSGRGGESDAQDVASYTMNRQSAVVEHLSGESSYGAQVIALGPAGIPLRMVSGYFAPVTLLNPVVERSFNTLLIPGRLGDNLRVERFVAFMLVYWVTVLSWPLLAPGLLLGMRRMARAGGEARALLAVLATTFLLVMVISMQERHRVPVLAFNPLLLAAWSAAPPSAEERVFARGIAGGAVAVILALNLWVYVRGT